MLYLSSPVRISPSHISPGSVALNINDHLPADSLSRQEGASSGLYSIPSSDQDPVFSFWYVSSSGKEVLEKDRAASACNGNHLNIHCHVISHAY